MSGSGDENEPGPLQRALQAVRDLRARVEAAESARTAPIAIVGAACRLPGGVVDLDGYWRLLLDGVDATSEVPPDRWDAAAWDGGPEPRPGRMVGRRGGFLTDIATFDAEFFGIAPREAVEMDPAQRLLLEVAWEGLEHAGIAPDALEGRPVGVFVGLGLSDYARRHFGSDQPERLTPWSGTGSFLSVAAGRISYQLGLSGPAITVDTACSSSLVAVHLAVQSLRRGETELALAGGANTLIAPEPSVYFSQLRALAPDGRCKTFDAAADGYGRGEGAGVVVLKRLADAVRDGDRVLAVIRGTAVNQDGRTNGLTAPSGRAQGQVIRQALYDAGLEPARVGYVEAHGTGTPLGDPIEIGALAQVFGDRATPVAVGSAKTNFGHLETAAGVAGLLKAALVLRHGTVPPHLHLATLNPRCELGRGLAIPTVATPMAGAAGVSSFGLSGTNAHVVLEAAPALGVAGEVAGEPGLGPSFLALSAGSEAALRALAGRYAASWAPEQAVAVASGVARRRATLPFRAGLAGDPEALRNELNALATGARPVGAPRRGRAPEVVFAFTGQGSQHVGMGVALRAADAGFRAAWDDVVSRLDPLLPVPLEEVIRGEPAGALDDTRYTQPALFALQVALWRWWEAAGVVPDAVVGHSVGEFAAAVAAGWMDLDDAARLVCARARLMSGLPTGGAMLAVAAPESDVGPLLVGRETEVALAGVNGPQETVVSGEAGAVAEVGARLEASGVRVRKLHVSHAFHSPLIEPMVEAWSREVARVALRRGDVAFEPTGGGDPADTAYWVAQVRQPVRFAEAVARLGARGHQLFVELGPRPVLSGLGAAALPGSVWRPSLRPDRPEPEALLGAAAALWEAGATVRPAALTPPAPWVELPLTPFTGERHWLPALPRSTEASGAPTWVERWVPAVVRPATEPGAWVVVGGVRAATLVSELRRAGEEARLVAGDAPVEAADRVVVALDGDDVTDVSGAMAVAARWLARDAGRTALWTVDATGEVPGLVGAALWGLGRVARLELPGRVALVDAAEADEAFTLLRGAPEAVARVVDGRVEVPRLVPAPAGPRDPVAIEGTWLVAGGLGALGQRVARWLGTRGAGRIVLVGRSGGSAEARAMVARLVAEGLPVEAVAADLADPVAADAVIAALPDLRGVVHAAGVLDDARLAALDPDRLAAVVRAKLDVAWNLARAARGRRLSAFVLFSSATATLGTVGQAAYAGANAAVSALAARLRSEGWPAVAVAWGPWRGEGMADVPTEVAAAWERAGVRQLDPDQALAALDGVIGGGTARVLVAPIEWARFAADRPGDDHLLDELVPRRPDAPASPGFVAGLASLGPAARRRSLGTAVAEAVGAVLGRADVAWDQGLFDAGLDSLMAIELRDRLQQRIGGSLPATVAFDHPSVDALTDWLLAEVLDLGESVAPVARVEVAAGAPIAVIGSACRYPGAPDLEAFWELLREGRDAVGPVPDGRFDLDAVFDPTPGTPGRTYAREAGYVAGLEDFDAARFGITPREARSMDPQQRLLLEVAVAALDDAAIAPESLRERSVGVFVGIGPSEYGRRFDPLDPAAEADPYVGTGNQSSFAAGRVAYTLGVHGPAMSVDTACSSSLVALHLAIAALRAGECELAVVGGVNAITAPDTTVQLAQIRALSPTSRCHTFDAAADGYARGEGAGAVVLRRGDLAEAAGDAIRGWLLGSAVNHDGPSAGLTVPNGPAQQAVIAAALAQAGVRPDAVSFVECHGTGTPLGDPIEVGALAAVFGRRDRPLWLGSVKTNLGHLEAGAGLAGLLKLLLMGERGEVAPHLHLERINPELPLDGFAEIATERRPWIGPDRVAGLSGFGLSGTNAHVVVRLPGTVDRVDEETPREPRLVVLSGHAPELVRRDAARLADLAVRGDDLIATIHAGRASGPWRAHAVVAAGEPVGAALRRLAAAEPVRAGRPRVGWLFTGQGSQHPGMGRALYEAHAPFREVVDAVAALADPALPRPLRDVMFGGPHEEGADRAIDDTRYAQPTLFAWQVGVAAVLRSWGHEPDVVAGHSVGQLAAAVVAGVLSVEDGARVAVARGQRMGDLPREGRMVAVRVTEAVAAEVLAGVAGADVAAVNGPEDVVIAGFAAAIDEVEARLRARGVTGTALRTSHAFHSPAMDPALAAFEADLAGVRFAAPRIPLVETLRGAVGGDELGRARYWVDHVRGTVRFGAALVEVGARADVLVEVGPHPVLLGFAAAVVPEAARIPTARREGSGGLPGPSGAASLLDAAGQLAVRGAKLDLHAVNGGVGRRVHLPPRPLDRKRAWVPLPDRSAATAAVTLAVVGWRATALPGPTSVAPIAVVGASAFAGEVAAALSARLVAQVDEVGAAEVVVDARALDRGADAIAGRELVGLARDTWWALRDRPRVRLIWLTRGAHAEGATNPAQRALWGFAATASLEGTERRITAIDLDDGATAKRVERAVVSGVERVRISGDEFLTPQWTEVAGTPAGVAGTWWVTGGGGAVGLAVAEDLVKRGASALVLSGRGSPGPEVEAGLARWSEAGVTARWWSVDVADEAAVRAVVAAVGAAGLGPIAGVVHAAGVLRDEPIAAMTDDAIDAVWRGKVVGAERLAAALPHAELVFCSSAAGWLGSVGQAAYGAANAWLDGFAERLRGEGRRASAVAFGAWSVGFAARVPRDWVREGIRPLAPSRAVAALAVARSAAPASVAFLDLDRSRWLASNPGAPGWLAVGDPAPAPASAWADRLTGLPVALRVAGLAQRVRERVAAVSGRAAEEVDPSVGLFEAGFDSLMAVELVERLREDVGVALPRTLVFDHGSPEALTGYLVSVLGWGEDASEVVEAPAHRVALGEPIAIIGLALRYPGASNPEAFWELLARGEDRVGEVPLDRWDPDAQPPLPDGRSVARHGAFLTGIDLFDAEFFGMSPREADALDPQQRLLLEVCWEALEGAGQASELRGSRTGVYVGVAESDYLQRFRRAGDPQYADLYAGTGNEGSFPAGRVAYLLGLQGPAISLNTACSSALVAIHLACAGLRLGECDRAVAGGVSLMLAPDNHRYLSQLGALSPTGRCHTFDAAADGYARGEGCGVVVLKRLSDARRDGDRVLATILGSAVNHDGASSGLTVPNGQAQQRVIREALAAAGVTPDQVGYVEAHGTGTPLGDPVEVRALREVLVAGHDADHPLWLGSVKTNLGHLEQAAAAASVHKVVLALQHGALPPHLHLHHPNPDLPLGEEIRIPSRLEPWTGPRVAGISSFGISGTNAHLVLAAGDAPEPAPPGGRELAFVPVSGRTAAGLRDGAAALAAWWSANPAVAVAEVAATRLIERESGRYRAAVVADSATAAQAALQRVVVGAPVTEPPRLVFLYTGQGAQTAGMGADLYAQEPVFREVIDRVAAVVAANGGPDLRPAMFDPDGAALLDRTEVTQPALFAFELAMTELWARSGIVPEAVLGHSVGRLAAAVTAGSLSLEEGAALVTVRGAVMGALPAGGRMVAVGVDEPALAELLAGLDGVELAAVNAPGEVVLSGSADGVAAVEARCAATGVTVTALRTSHAFHSHRMEPAVAVFDQAARNVTWRDPRLVVGDDLTGRVDGAEFARAGSWAEAIRRPVRFADAARALRAAGYRHFVEVGNHPVLAGLVSRCVDDAITIPSSRRDVDPARAFAEAAARLWELGAPLDGFGFLGRGRARLPLPTSAMHHERHWLPGPEFPEAQGVPVRGWRIERAPVAVGAAPARVAVVVDDGLRSPATVTALRASGVACEEIREAGGSIAVPSGVGAVVDAREGAWVDRTLSLASAATVTGVRAVWLAGPEEAAAITAFARVLGEEAEEVDPLVIDLGTGTPGSGLAAALGVTGERVVHLDRGAPTGDRLVEAPLGGAPPVFDADGAWLVTGGLGALGRQLAAWLVARGVRHLWLVGRSGTRPEAEADLAALRAAGASVHVVAADVTDRSALEAALAAIRAERPLTGVVHAAGALDDARVADQTPARFEAVLAPKLTGARLLDGLTRDDGLRHFVVISSAAAILGLPGQSTYAAANAAVDELVERRRAAGLPGLSVRFGPWGGGGMAGRLDPSVVAHQRRLGVEPLDPSVALDRLGAAMSGADAVVAVLRVDWRRHLARFEGREVPALLRSIAGAVAPAPVAASGAARSPDAAPADRALVALVKATPRAAWQPAIEAFLASEINALQRAAADRSIDRERPLTELGMDSMSTVELRNVLVGAGVRLPVARMIAGPSVVDLALMVIAELEKDPALAPAPAARDDAATATDPTAEPPLNPVWTHLGAAFGGAVVMAIVAFVTWQVLYGYTPAP